MGGSSRRGTLKTRSISVAKARLPLALERARARWSNKEAGSAAELVTVGDWLGEWSRRQRMRPRLKSSTKEHDGKLVRLLSEEKWARHDVRRLPAGALEEWWADFCARCEAPTVNARLRVLKAAMRLAVQEGAVPVSPVEDLERKRLVHKVVDLPTVEVMRQVIESIRKQGRVHSEEAAAMVELGMLSGLRPAELASVRGEDFKSEYLIVRGDPSGTKNRREREVPMVPALMALVKRMTWREISGPIFSMGSPRRALRAACVRMGIRPLKPYDLRHFFITRCIEAGVDVPTVALWAGHTDGGALLMATYTHITRQHSVSAAARVEF